MALSQDDESLFGVYENTAIEVEYVQPITSYQTPQKNDISKIAKKAFLQLDDSGDVSVMVKRNTKKREGIIDTDVHIPKDENESIPQTIPNVLSDLSEDDDKRHVLSSNEKNNLLNHLADEAKEEFDKQKLNQSLQSQEDEDDDISAILDNWNEKETNESTTTTTDDDDDDDDDVVVESTEELVKETKVENKYSSSPPRKFRSLQHPTIQTVFSDEKIARNHVGEIDKKVVQTKISSGVATHRISQLQEPSSPSRSITSSGSRIHLPKIKIPHLQSAKGFSPVLDEDEEEKKEKREKRESVKTSKPNQSQTKQTERSLPSPRENSEKVTKREQFPSPQGVDQFPSQTPSHQMRRSMTYGGSGKSVGSRATSPTKSDPYATPKFKVFPKLKTKNKDSRSEKELLMREHHNSKGKSLWGSRKKRD